MRMLLAVCGALTVTTCAALAADPVRVSLSGPRHTPTVGQPWSATLKVRPSSFRGAVRVTAVGPGRVVARVSRRRNAYRARLVFPSAGRWRLTARAGGSTSQLGSVTVRRLPALRFAWPTSVDDQPDGSLLVVENGRSRVLVVEPANGRTRELASGFGKPYAALRAPSGTIVVSDGRALKRIDAGGAPQTIATADEDIGPIAVAPNGDVFYTTGTPLLRLPAAGGAPQTVATGFIGAHGLAVAADGAVLVSDTGNDRVVRVDPASGASATLFTTADPRGIDVAPDGTIYVVESESKRVGRYNAGGARLGAVGPVYGDPYDVAAGSGGAVFVVDTAAAGVVRRVAANGTTVTIPTG
jgi:sugar lactone lactonase YvrE